MNNKAGIHQLNATWRVVQEDKPEKNQIGIVIALLPVNNVADATIQYRFL